METKLITAKEAAKLLGCTDSRIRQIILSGGLRSRKFGKSHALDRSEVMALRRKRGKTQPKPSNQVTEQATDTTN